MTCGLQAHVHAQHMWDATSGGKDARWMDALCPAFEPYIINCSCFPYSNSIKHTASVWDPLFSFLQLRINVNKRPSRVGKKGKAVVAGMTIAFVFI